MPWSGMVDSAIRNTLVFLSIPNCRGVVGVLLSTSRCSNLQETQ